MGPGISLAMMKTLHTGELAWKPGYARHEMRPAQWREHRDSSTQRSFYVLGAEGLRVYRWCHRASK